MKWRQHDCQQQKRLPIKLVSALRLASTGMAAVRKLRDTGMLSTFESLPCKKKVNVVLSKHDSFFFPSMHGLEAKAFVYLSIKNELERTLENSGRGFCALKEDGIDPFLTGVFTVNC